MSNKADSITIGGREFTLALLTIKKNIRTLVDQAGQPVPAGAVPPNGPDGKPIVYKHKMLATDYGIVGPNLVSVSDWKDFITAILDEAETREAGGGVALARVLLESRLEAASDHNFDLETGKSEPENWKKQISSAEPPRSAPLGIEAINKAIADLAPELALMAPHMATADGWQQYLTPEGAPVYKSQDEFLLRFYAIQKQLKRYLQLIADKHTAAAAKKAKRDAIAAEAAKAAAALAAGAPPIPGA